MHPKRSRAEPAKELVAVISGSMTFQLDGATESWLVKTGNCETRQGKPTILKMLFLLKIGIFTV